MRAAVLLLVAGCGFSVQATGTDAAPDTPIDTVDSQPPVTWSVDPSSEKGVPATRMEWADMIAARGLAVQPPDGLWLLQESAGNLDDLLGTADLIPIGAVGYRAPVAGWSRMAVKTTDDTVAWFSSISPSLPDMSTSSMMVLMYFAREGASPAPGAPRTTLVAGSSSRLAFGRIDIDPAGTLGFSVLPNAAAGTTTYTQNVAPIVLVHDRAHSRQLVVTDKETIAPTFSQRLPSRGLFLGGADYRAPEGRWLYLAAWYGANAEVDQADVQSMLSALGW